MLTIDAPPADAASGVSAEDKRNLESFESAETLTYDGVVPDIGSKTGSSLSRPGDL